MVSTKTSDAIGRTMNFSLLRLTFNKKILKLMINQLQSRTSFLIINLGVVSCIQIYLCCSGYLNTYICTYMEMFVYISRYMLDDSIIFI